MNKIKKIAFINSSWFDENDSLKWGVRAGSRWPHMQKRPELDVLPRYIPFPFFLATAAQIAKNAGYSVLLIDAVAEDMQLEEMYDTIRAFSPNLIFSESSTPSLKADIAVFAKLKEILPNAVIVTGGSQSTSIVPELMKKHSLPDFWIGGEYEESLLLLANALNDNTDFKNIPGLISRNGILNPPAKVTNINHLPSPLFEMLPIQNYSDPVCGLPAPVAQIWLSRGCPFKCSFCVWPQVVFGDRKYRVRDTDKALDDIETLINNYGCESFYFDDDTTNIGPDRMFELAAKIKGRGLDKYPWSMMARADCMTNEVLDALKDAGMYSVKYGVESISPKLINSCEKGTNLLKLKKSINHTKEIGIKLHLTFMFGIAGETEETIDETMAFAMEVKPDTAQFSLCTPFPGTKFYNQCKKNGWLTTDDWSSFLGTDEAVVSTPWLSAERLQIKYRKAVEIWKSFNLKRLEEKQNQLAEKLFQSVKNGNLWTLEGDKEFAQFIWDKNCAEISKAFADPAIHLENIQKVIISKHNEEKIFRNLKRINPEAAEKTLRLFG